MIYVARSGADSRTVKEKSESAGFRMNPDNVRGIAIQRKHLHEELGRG